MESPIFADPSRERIHNTMRLSKESNSTAGCFSRVAGVELELPLTSYSLSVFVGNSVTHTEELLGVAVR